MPDPLDEVREIITKSGNSFHCRVMRELVSKGWTVQISPYYNDSVTGKPREVDLIAEKSIMIPLHYGQYRGHFNIRLYIECKYVAQKNVFWFFDRDSRAAEEMIVKKFPKSKTNSSRTDFHHLAHSLRVGKLFAGETNKSGDNELFFKAISQSLNALIYYRDKPSIIKSPDGTSNKTTFTMQYPLVICNSFDNIYSTDMDKDSDPKLVTDNFMFEMLYAYSGSDNLDKTEYFLIDIVNFNQLDDILAKVENDFSVVTMFS